MWAHCSWEAQAYLWRSENNRKALEGHKFYMCGINLLTNQDVVWKNQATCPRNDESEEPEIEVESKEEKRKLKKAAKATPWRTAHCWEKGHKKKKLETSRMDVSVVNNKVRV